MDYNITYRQKNKGWQFIISYKINGKWKQKTKQGFKSKKEAKLFALDFIDKNSEIFETESFNNVNMDVTLKELLNEYINTQKFYQSASSISNLQYSIKSFSDLFDYKIIEITEDDLQNCVNKLINRKFKYSTIKSKVGYCKLLFNFAIKRYPFFKINPANNLKIVKDTVLISRRALEPDEEIELLNILKTSNRYSKYYLTALFCLKAGLRIGEVGGLQFKDINFDKKTISINKQWKMIDYSKSSSYAKFGIGPLKSKNSNRIIPITKDLLEILKDMNTKHGPNDFIVEFGNKRSFQTTMNRDMKKLGFNICIHELRHTYATKLIKAGIDLKTVAYLMGHDLKMTIEVYSHVTNDMFNTAQQIIDLNL